MEVSFPNNHFLHLTIISTYLSAKDFYSKAKKAKLTNHQLYFDSRHPYSNAKKKLSYLEKLLELTMNQVFILKDFKTITIIYKLSITISKFTLCLTENIDKNGNKINNLYLPMSLRVKGKIYRK